MTSPSVNWKRKYGVLCTSFIIPVVFFVVIRPAQPSGLGKLVTIRPELPGLAAYGGRGPEQTPGVPPPLEVQQARIQGVVSLAAVIGKDGRMANLNVVSGHPLLIAAAVDAVRQWVYQPTLLNGQPVEVQTQVDVNFTLSQ